MRKIIIFLFFGIIFFAQSTYGAICDNLSQYTLRNGQTVIIKEVKDNPIVIIDTFIKTGSVNENDKNNGVAHFLEHLFFKGTTKHKRGEFEKAIESKGGIFNAATSRDYTHYYIKIDSKHIDDALSYHSDMLLNIAIPENELEMERKVVLEEITRSMDNPENKVFDNFLNIIFNGNSYSRKILGTNEIISSISRDEILAFHNHWYKPSNMVTVVVGDVEAEKILPKIAKNFKCTNSLPNKELKTNGPEAPTPRKIKNQTIIEKSDIDTGYMVIGYPTVGINNLKEAYALDIVASILSGGQNSILYKVLKEEENLIIDATAGNYELKDGGVFYVSSNFEPQNYSKILQKIKTELNNLKQKPIDENKLKMVKNSIKRQYEYANEGIANIANMLGYDVAVGNGIKDYCNYIPTIESIDSEFIQQTIKKYFIEENQALSVLLPKKSTKISQSNKIIEINNRNKIDAKLISEHKNIKKYKLKNGATLLAEKTDSNNVIGIKIFLKGGSVIEEKDGTASLLANTIMKGTKSRSGKELEDALDNIGTNISVADNFEYFEISMKTTKADLNQAFLLLKEILEEPAFDEKDITNAKKDAINNIIAARDNPQNLAFENFYEGIYANSPFLKTGKILEKSIPNINKEDIENLHKKIFAAENMVISIAGNFDDNDIINKFSTLTNPKGHEAINLEILKANLSPLENNIIKKEGKNAKGSWLIQGWQTKGLSTNDFVTLKVISTYLGSGFSSQLFTNLRENKGLAYEVGASSGSNFNSGIIFMYIGTNPENLDEIEKEFAREINQLKSKYISQKELCDLKTMLVGRIKLATETNMSKAYLNGYYEFFDKGYSFSYDYPELIQKVSVQDILDVANKYFSQPYVMSIVAEEKYINNNKGKE